MYLLLVFRCKELLGLAQLQTPWPSQVLLPLVLSSSASSLSGLSLARLWP